MTVGREIAADACASQISGIHLVLSITSNQITSVLQVMSYVQFSSTSHHSLATVFIFTYLVNLVVLLIIRLLQFSSSHTLLPRSTIVYS
jgi:hypothetical protein